VGGIVVDKYLDEWEETMSVVAFQRPGLSQLSGSDQLDPGDEGPKYLVWTELNSKLNNTREIKVYNILEKIHPQLHLELIGEKCR
jgi:hypothetical protein